jgi:hypothetical protein
MKNSQVCQSLWIGCVSCDAAFYWLMGLHSISQRLLPPPGKAALKHRPLQRNSDEFYLKRTVVLTLKKKNISMDDILLSRWKFFLKFNGPWPFKLKEKQNVF